ncbi:MAG: response regulator [Planctomycetota bacterium]|jgi:chemotaxis receptor (MCP) glutamine deamidase CheD/CheY-like chemotaxis protein|nr:response regulator [Planctomycetota bacterium]
MAVATEQVFLLPGEYHVSRIPCHMATLLGSCVAVCLHHETKPYAAMNHYLLAVNPGGSEPEKGRFGDTSIENIVWLMKKLDENGKMTAKIYGGAAVVSHLGTTTDIGGKNIEMARTILKRRGIPIVEEDVAGTRGRRIYYDTAANTVTVKTIAKTEEGEKLMEKRRDLATRKTRVLVVDDSPLVRKILVKAISDTKDMEVCGQAGDAFEARDQILELDPDVISLDIIMPKLDGLKFLKSLSQHYPKPVVICSTIAKDQSQVSLKAREYGAVDVIDKDKLELYKGPDVIQRVYIPKIRMAAGKVVRKMLFPS